MILKGIIVSGNKEGRKYMSMKEYLKIFEEKFNMKPFPGTLNVKISEEEFIMIKKLCKKINGFYLNGKYFGGFYYVKGRISSLNVLIIIPELTKYKDVIEIVSDKYLRKELNLKDGDEIIIHLNDVGKNNKTGN